MNETQTNPQDNETLHEKTDLKKDHFVITSLAELPEGSILDETALASALKVSTRTLRRMVARFEVPPGVKLGGRKVWIAGKVLEYLTVRAEKLAKEAAFCDEDLQRRQV